MNLKANRCSLKVRKNSHKMGSGHVQQNSDKKTSDPSIINLCIAFWQPSKLSVMSWTVPELPWWNSWDTYAVKRGLYVDHTLSKHPVCPVFINTVIMIAMKDFAPMSDCTVKRLACSPSVQEVPGSSLSGVISLTPSCYTGSTAKLIVISLSSSSEVGSENSMDH